jgi:hypothetical protein
MCAVINCANRDDKEKDPLLQIMEMNGLEKVCPDRRRLWLAKLNKISPTKIYMIWEYVQHT